MSNDPTKDPEFKRVLGNLLKAPPKKQVDMKVGKRKPSKTKRLSADDGDGPVTYKALMASPAQAKPTAPVAVQPVRTPAKSK